MTGLGWQGERGTGRDVRGGDMRSWNLGGQWECSRRLHGPSRGTEAPHRNREEGAGISPTPSPSESFLALFVPDAFRVPNSFWSSFLVP